MTSAIDDSLEGIEQIPLQQFTEKAYLDYAMYVILDRALPHVADGLKPVQRRIVYAMSELGLKNTAKFKKSARTIGDVLGKFHPHGDSACYEAMVLMAQSFSYRYPLVDGQGNWGSADDPKSFAAMRYTEARLSPYAQILLDELGEGTTDWVPNFDGTLKEPALLPAQVPNILLNGTSGIAVGMATDVPPHNLGEVIDACVLLLENSRAPISELLEVLPGPDYPTRAEIITPRGALADIYEKGTGSVRMRATYEMEQGEIVVNALPHQVSGAKILEQIATQMRSKKLPMVSDLRDESDHENPTRLVIIPRSNRIDVEGLMSHLFATTDLERTYRVNLNLIGLDGRPKVKNLKTILSEWLEYRLETVRRRLQYRLDKIISRMHILEGLLIAYLNIDEVIQIIRTEDKPKPVLIQRFSLTDEQADAILDLKLRHLAKLEEMKIKGEQDELSAEREKLELTLSSKARMKTLVKKELLAIKKECDDGRRSPLQERAEAQAIKEETMLSNDPVTVILSQKGWIRCAKGHEVDTQKLSYKSGDSELCVVQGRSNQQAIFLDSTGRSYSIAAHTLPSARGLGDPLTSKLSPPSGAAFVTSLMGADKDKVLLASNAGYGFITELGNLVCKNKNGKAILKLPAEGEVLTPATINDMKTDYIAVLGNLGHLLIFPASELPELAKGKGNKMMNIPSAKFAKGEERVVGFTILTLNDTLHIHAGKRSLKLKGKDLKHYLGERAKRGLKLPRGYQKADRIQVEKTT